MVLDGSALELLLDTLIWVVPAFALAWVLLRHVPLALLAAFGPLPAVIFAATVLRSGTLFDYPFGFCVGLLTSAALLRRFLGAGRDWRDLACAAAGAGATLASQHWQAAVSWMLCGASAAALVAAGFRWLKLGEAFVARANRLAESRARLLETASHIAVPRWAMALSGIALVLAALGWFEVAPPLPPYYPGIVVIAAAAFLLARDWRSGVAAALCAALLWLLGLDDALAFFALPALLLAAGTRGRPEQGGPAWRLALEEEGAGLLLAGLSLAALPLQLPGGSGIENPFAAAEAFGAALLFFPALTVALWSLFPRRRSVKDLYRS